MKAYYKGVGLEVLCSLVGYTRQAYYKRQAQIEKEKFEASIIVDLVLEERKIAKRVGSKKLYLILKSELGRHGIRIGKDKFHEVLRANDLLVKTKRRRPKTTDSRHKLRVYPNKARNLRIDRSELLWVSDITYIRVGDRWHYLMLITDSYSRKVVGHHFSRRMDTQLCVMALEKALGNRSYPERSLMHHSDRGSQYCSEKYTNMLRLAKIIISMTQKGDPLENPLAERMNRVFKDTFGLDETFNSFHHAQHVINQAVEYYNGRLPHSSIDLLTPTQAHHRVGRLNKHWKWYWREKQILPLEDNFYTPY